MSLFSNGNRGLIVLLVLAALLSVALTSCVTTRTVVIDTACNSFRIINWGDADTPKTIWQVREHNAAYDALCGSI